MFVIVWGTNRRKECLGEVGDWCDTCRQVQPFTDTRRWQAGHIYGIRVEREHVVNTECTCWECGEEYYCDADDYDDFLREEEVETMSMAELLARTNPLLKARLDRRRKKGGRERPS